MTATTYRIHPQPSFNFGVGMFASAAQFNQVRTAEFCVSGQRINRAILFQLFIKNTPSYSLCPGGIQRTDKAGQLIDRLWVWQLRQLHTFELRNLTIQLIDLGKYLGRRAFSYWSIVGHKCGVKSVQRCQGFLASVLYRSDQNQFLISVEARLLAGMTRGYKNGGEETGHSPCCHNPIRALFFQNTKVMESANEQPKSSDASYPSPQQPHSGLNHSLPNPSPHHLATPIFVLIGLSLRAPCHHVQQVAA